MDLNGAAFAKFDISLSSAPTTDPIAVSWRTEDASAVDGVDYQGADGVVTFGIGETEKSIYVLVFGQPANGPSKTFRLILEHGLNIGIETPVLICTITPGDQPDPEIPPGLDLSVGAPGPAAWDEPVAYVAGITASEFYPITTVIYEGQTYVAKTGSGIFTTGAIFDASKWTLVAARGYGVEAMNLMSVAELQAATIPVLVQYVMVYLGGVAVPAFRVGANPNHALAALASNGQWWEFRPQIVTPAMAASADLAAEAAYAMGRPLMVAGQTAKISLTFSTTDGKANYAKIVAATAWKAKCVCGPGGKIDLYVPGEGLFPLTVYDVNASGQAVIIWDGHSAGPWSLTCDAPTSVDITGVSFGTRGMSQHPVRRHPNQYPVTITAALPSRVTAAGWAVAARDVVGDNDAMVATGAYVVESVAGDRSSFVGTVISENVTNLLNPTSLTNGGTWNTIPSTTLLVPKVCFLWDTDYTLGANVTVSALFNAANGPAGATTLNVTANAHGITAGSIVEFVSASSNLDGARFRVYSVPNANTIVITDLNGDTIDGSAMVLTMGAVVRKLTPVWTGALSNQEGIVNSADGSLHFNGIGFSYAGWLKSATGIYMNQEAIAIGSPGGSNSASLYANDCIFAGAGDKVLRAYNARAVSTNRSWVGGGGCQTAIYLQMADASLVRGGFGQSIRENLSASIAGRVVINACCVVGSGSIANIAPSGNTTVYAYPAKIGGANRAIYPTYGANIRVDDTTYIDCVATGIDGFLWPSSVNGARPTFGPRATTQTALNENGVGGATGNKGNAQFVSAVTGNIAPPHLFTTWEVKATGIIAFTVGASMTGTLAMSGGAGFSGAKLTNPTLSGAVTLDAGVSMSGTVNMSAATLNSPTLTTPAINNGVLGGGTITTAALVAPSISGAVTLASTPVFSGTSDWTAATLNFPTLASATLAGGTIIPSTGTIAFAVGGKLQDANFAGINSMNAGASVRPTKGVVTAVAIGATVVATEMVTIIQTNALSLAAGATGEITFQHTMLEGANSFATISFGYGTNTVGAPVVFFKTRVAGSMKIVIRNDHASVALDGSLDIIVTVYR